MNNADICICWMGILLAWTAAPQPSYKLATSNRYDHSSSYGYGITPIICVPFLLFVGLPHTIINTDLDLVLS